MGLVAARSLTLSDNPKETSTFGGRGRVDRIDVTVLNADAKLELQLPGGEWHSEAIRIRAGSFKSIAGLAIAYPRTNGVDGCRLSNWTPGAIADVDVEIWSA